MNETRADGAEKGGALTGRDSAPAAPGPSAHLSWAELACRDAAGTPYPDEWRTTRALTLAREFEAVRRSLADRVGREVPLQVRSAFRTRDYNRSIGGAPNSQHCEGRALDLAPMDADPRVLEALYQVVFGRARSVLTIRGVGRYDTFVHMDVRPTADLALWDERSKGRK